MALIIIKIKIIKELFFIKYKMNTLIILYLVFVYLINNIICLPILLLTFMNKSLLVMWNNTFWMSLGYFMKIYNVSIYIKNKKYFKELLETKDKNRISIQNHLSQHDFVMLSRLLSINNEIPTKLHHFY